MEQIILIVAIATGLILSTFSTVEAKTYNHPQYTVDYPNGCKLEKGGSKYETHAFNIECKGNIGIQIESGEDISDYFTSIDPQDQITDIETLMQLTWDTETVESGPTKYIINDVFAPYVIGTYEQEFTNFFGLPAESENWVVMAIAVDIGHGQKVVAEYRNDAKHFDGGLPFAEKIFESIKGTGSNSQSGSGSHSDSGQWNSTEHMNKTRSGATLDPKVQEICDNPPNKASKDVCDIISNN